MRVTRRDWSFQLQCCGWKPTAQMSKLQGNLLVEPISVRDALIGLERRT
jgi:hypothetical protein